MGNQCPECDTPVENCKMRQVFAAEPRNRDDLDLSHLKRGQYIKKSNKKQIQNSRISIGRKIDQSILIQQSKKLNSENKPPIKEQPNQSQVKSIKRPLSIAVDAINTLQLKRGVQYSGGTVDNQPHERGKIVWQDGTILNGQFFLGQLAENQNIYIEMADGSIYDGQIIGGKANGKGKLTLSNGIYIEGFWENDVPHGFAKHKMTNNSLYQGNFIKGVKSGKGILYFQEGRYEGLFENDQFNGQGALFLTDGRIVRGIWKNGLLDGKGVMQWRTGDKYDGQYSKGLREGKGKYYFSDGREWNGQWKNDQQNGFGSYQVDGTLIKSVWVSGVKKQQMRQADLNFV